ncbi:MAG: hypothetical protein IPK76_07205 [Lewinellaceae bacterium]|nr:hypothetical protein [Lewinellaceae bacterium]
MVLVLLFFALIAIGNLFASRRYDAIDDVDWRDEYYRRQDHPLNGPPGYLPPYNYYQPFYDPQRLYEMENRRQEQLIKFFFMVIAAILAAYFVGKYF